MVEKPNSHGGIMQRRDVLKMLATGAVLPVFSSPLAAFFREAQAQTGPGYKLRTLNPHENATVVVMTDLIIPETDTPGAKAARVNEFIDVILTEWATEEERQNFLNGVAGGGKKRQESFWKRFVVARDQQPNTLFGGREGFSPHEGGAEREGHRDTEAQRGARMQGK